MFFPTAAVALATARTAAAIAGVAPADIERIRLRRLEEDARAARLAEKRRVERSQTALATALAVAGVGSCALLLFS